jgi:hypothetical protein
MSVISSFHKGVDQEIHGQPGSVETRRQAVAAGEDLQPEALGAAQPSLAKPGRSPPRAREGGRFDVEGLGGVAAAGRERGRPQSSRKTTQPMLPWSNLLSHVDELQPFSQQPGVTLESIPERIRSGSNDSATRILETFLRAWSSWMFTRSVRSNCVMPVDHHEIRRWAARTS